MIDIGMLNAMVASIGVGSLIGVAIAALVVGAVISAFIFKKKV